MTRHLASFERFELLRVQSGSCNAGLSERYQVVNPLERLLFQSAGSCIDRHRLIAEHVCTSTFRTLTTCINKMQNQTCELGLKSTYGTNSCWRRCTYMRIMLEVKSMKETLQEQFQKMTVLSYARSGHLAKVSIICPILNGCS